MKTKQLYNSSFDAMYCTVQLLEVLCELSIRSAIDTLEEVEDEWHSDYCGDCLEHRDRCGCSRTPWGE